MLLYVVVDTTSGGVVTSVMGTALATLLIKSPENDKNVHDHSDVPLPPCMHKILSKSQIGHNHIFVVGDVHGCLDELKTLVANARRKAKDKCVFIFVGDLINKGPLNKETLDYIRSLGNKAYAVRGNHDEHIVKYWLRFKAGDCKHIKEKYSWVSDLTSVDIDYLLSLPYTISIPHLETLIVHAGVDPYKSLANQRPEVMTKIRNVVGVDNMEETYATADSDEGTPWASLWSGPEHIYFGHDAQRGYQDYPFATGLDTGCVYGKQLSGKFITGTKKLICVQAKTCYTEPGKKEREKLFEKDVCGGIACSSPDPKSVFGLKNCNCEAGNCHHMKYVSCS